MEPVLIIMLALMGVVLYVALTQALFALTDYYKAATNHLKPKESDNE